MPTDDRIDVLQAELDALKRESTFYRISMLQQELAELKRESWPIVSDYLKRIENMLYRPHDLVNMSGESYNQCIIHAFLRGREEGLPK